MKRLLKYAIITLMITVIGLSSISAQETVKSGFKKLDLWTEQCHIDRPMTLGYPCNQVMTLTGFYKWYTDNKEHYDELGLPTKWKHFSLTMPAILSAMSALYHQECLNVK